MADEALLAPVPADLLADAADKGLTRVAFGSLAWDFFQRLTADHGHEPLDVLIYASHAEEFALEVEWAGTFSGWRDAMEAEGDPAFMRDLRSPKALLDWVGNEEGGRWAVYWIVDNFHRLEHPIPLADLHLPNGKRLSGAFIPRGPTRIQAIDRVLWPAGQVSAIGWQAPSGATSSATRSACHTNSSRRFHESSSAPNRSGRSLAGSPTMTPSLADRLAGAVWGHLVGDAVGVPYEFRPPVRPERVEFGAKGSHRQPPGTWSDDGALMLALLDSLLEKGFDTTHQAQRALAWAREGRYAAGLKVFDIGGATSRALSRFESGVPAEEAGADDQALGNGSLMRILPLALVERETTTEELIDHAHRASKVTHGAAGAEVACALYSLIVRSLLKGDTNREGSIEAARRALRETYSVDGDDRRLTALGELESWTARSGRGFVIDSFWSAWDAFAGATTYEETVRRAIAYGDDTDTTAAIAAGLAGAYWGIDAVPISWRKGMRDRGIVRPLVAKLRRRPPATYRVYVIELRPEVWDSDRDLRDRNPHRRSDKPIVYVGHTGLTPEARFAKHKRGGLGTSSLVKQFGSKLKPKLYESWPTVTSRTAALALELKRADGLRRKGYTVWEGGRKEVAPARHHQRQSDSARRPCIRADGNSSNV